MFSLTKHETKVRNYTAFKEFAGDDRVLAGSLSLEVTTHSSMLDQFDPKLRPLLYRKPEHENEQPRADDDLTEVRRPQLGDLRWDEEFPGYALAIGSLDAIEPLAFREVKLAGFKLSPQQGGVLKITFRAVLHPTEEESGQLDSLIQDTIDVTLTPPAAGATREPDLVDQANAAADEKPEADVDRDPLHDAAVEFVRTQKRVRPVDLQKKLKIGYNRACHLMEALATQLVVSAEPDFESAREVLPEGFAEGAAEAARLAEAAEA